MSEYFSEIGEPLKCTNCNSDRIKPTAKDTIANVVCEQEYTCINCNKIVGYWAYGYFDPCFQNEAL